MRVDNWTFVDRAFLTQSDSHKFLTFPTPDGLFKVPVALVVYNGVHEMLRLRLCAWYVNSR